jgi:hypothetical protein
VWAQTACDAIAKRRRVQVNYDGYSRVVEIHACGVSKTGHEVARVWQVRGGSVHNEPVGWKLLRLDETLGAVLINEDSSAPRPGYQRGDRAMHRIFCEV